MSARRVGLASMECVAPTHPLRRFTIEIKFCQWPDPNPFPRFTLWRGWRKR